jgi:hypothetical protein
MLGFSHIAWALEKVTKGGGRENFVRGKEQQREFNDLKHRLCSALVLSFLDLQQPFEIETDAYEYVVGAILTQHSHLVAYHSETLLDVVRNTPPMTRKCIPLYKLVINGNITFWERIQSSTLITSLCNSYRHRGNCRTTSIRSGPPTCNSSIPTSSIRHGS